MRVAARENATSTHSIGEMQDILATLMKNSKIDESSRLARFVQSHLISGLSPAYKLRDLGVKQAPFYVLIGAEMPAILMEISFLTNPEEAKLSAKRTISRQGGRTISQGHSGLHHPPSYCRSKIITQKCSDKDKRPKISRYCSKKQNYPIQLR
jgi:N-acetylmuramoyl-L-alanine amidase